MGARDAMLVFEAGCPDWRNHKQDKFETTCEVLDYPSNYVADSEVKMATMSDEKKGMTELEGWIEQLMECKQLSENQVNYITCDPLGNELIDQLASGKSALWESQGDLVQGEQCAGDTHYSVNWLKEFPTHDGITKHCMNLCFSNRLSTVLSLCAEMSMVNSTTSWSSLKLEVRLYSLRSNRYMSNIKCGGLKQLLLEWVPQASPPIQTFCSWGTMWIVGTTVLKLSRF